MRWEVVALITTFLSGVFVTTIGYRIKDYFECKEAEREFGEILKKMEEYENGNRHDNESDGEAED